MENAHAADCHDAVARMQGRVVQDRVRLLQVSPQRAGRITEPGKSAAMSAAGVKSDCIRGSFAGRNMPHRPLTYGNGLLQIGQTRIAMAMRALVRGPSPDPVRSAVSVIALRRLNRIARGLPWRFDSRPRPRKAAEKVVEETGHCDILRRVQSEERRKDDRNRQNQAGRNAK